MHTQKSAILQGGRTVHALLFLLVLLMTAVPFSTHAHAVDLPYEEAFMDEVESEDEIESESPDGDTYGESAKEDAQLVLQSVSLDEIDPFEGLSYCRLLKDEKFPNGRTVTAKSFSDYQNSSGMASGAVIRFQRLITLEVVGLSTAPNEGIRNLALIERCTTLIRELHILPEYNHVMFKLVIPAGTYYLDGAPIDEIDQCIHLYSDTWLSMKQVTFIKADMIQRAMLRSGFGEDSNDGYNGESNLILEGGVWDIRCAQYRNTMLHFTNMRFGHGQNILIAGQTIKGSVSGHHLELCGTRNVSIVGCVFRDYVDSGHVKGINRNEAIQLDITHADYLTPNYPSYDDTSTGNVVIYDCNFQNVGRGIGSHSAVTGKYYTGIVIQKNTFQNLRWQAVHCQNYRKTYIGENTIQSCGGGIEFCSMTDKPNGTYYLTVNGAPAYGKIKTYPADSIIRRNTISIKPNSGLSNASGIYVHGGVAAGKSCTKWYRNKKFTIRGVSVESNTITSARDSGVTLRYAKGCTVKGNRISGIVKGKSSDGTGIRAAFCSSSIAMRNNIITKVAKNGVELYHCSGGSSAPVVLTKNQITAARQGVSVDGSQYVSMGGNAVTSRGEAVLISSSAHITVGSKNAKNTLTSSAQYAVKVQGKSRKAVTIHYNTVRAKKKAVNVASNSRAKAKNNSFRKN